MSAIAGIIQFDGGPVDPATIQRMTARLRQRLPERVASWIGDGAVFLHGTIAVTPGADREQQPLVGHQSGLIVTFDGRLDNRDEIIDALSLPQDATDAALVVEAAAAWGDDAASRLLGDFAFAVWNPRTRRLLCARDVSGVRTLHYRLGPGWIAFASALDLLVAGIAPLPDVNEGMVAEYLSSFIVDRHETLFRDVYRVPAAHLLTATSERHALLRYWRPDPSRIVRYRRDEEYEEHLRELLRRAVACRLRTPKPVAIMLSGGLDSSSVTGLAAALARDGLVPATAVEAFSISVPGPGDERAYFERVSEQSGVRLHCVDELRPAPGQFQRETIMDLDAQVYPHSPTVDAMRAAVRDRGARVLLTGMGGDDWLGTSPAAYADLLKRGAFVSLARRLHADRASPEFIGWRLTTQLGLWPLVPEPVKRVVRRGLGRGRAPAWIDSAFAARIGLPHRLAAFRPDLGFPSYEQEDMWFLATIGMTVHTGETVTRGGDRFGIEHWHPYRDRRVVEFGLGLPPDQLWRNGRPKDLLRRAMAPFVPAAVATRIASPSADHAFVHALEAESGTAAFADLEVARRGWIDAARVQALYARMHLRYENGRPDYASAARILWGIVAVNLWLEARTVVKYRDSPQEAAGD